MLNDIKNGREAVTADGYPIEVLKIFEGTHGPLIAGVYRIGKEGAYVSGLWDDDGTGIQDHPDLQLRDMHMDVKWEIIDKSIKYVVMDKDGDFQFHTQCPRLKRDQWDVLTADYYEIPGLIAILNTPYDAKNWKFSLTERP